MYEGLQTIEEGLGALLHDLDPARLHGADAVTALERFARIEKFATAGKMLVGHRVVETDAWKDRGKQSAAHLLADASGCTVAEAEALLRAARRLHGLPETEKAARRGKLSGRQADEVTRGAAADPAAEPDLLGLAEGASASELAAESKRRRLAAAGDDLATHHGFHLAPGSGRRPLLSPDEQRTVSDDADPADPVPSPDPDPGPSGWGDATVARARLATSSSPRSRHRAAAPSPMR